MRGRKPRLTPPRSKGQYTTTIEKQFYRLGTDKAAAEEQFRFLLNKHEMGEAVDDNPRFSVIVDKWLVYVEKNYDPERHRLCHDRLSEFTHCLGLTTRVRDLRPRHVEEWLQSKKDVKKAGTQRN